MLCTSNDTGNTHTYTHTDAHKHSNIKLEVNVGSVRHVLEELPLPFATRVFDFA